MYKLDFLLLLIAFISAALVPSSAFHTASRLNIFRAIRSISMTAASSVPFVKYQGLGNDFILVDNTKSSTPIYTPEEAVKICDRNFGIGGILYYLAYIV